MGTVFNHIDKETEMTVQQRKIFERAEDRTALVTSVLITGVAIIASIAFLIPLAS